MEKPSPEEIAQSIRELAGDILRDRGEDPGDIESNTRLNADLGYSSMDALHLLARIDMHYARKIDYEPLVVQGGRSREELSIGELASYVSENFDRPRPDPEPL